MLRKRELQEDQIPLMSKSNEDPFYTVRDNVNSQVERIKVRHEKFQDLVRNVDTSSNSEFKELRKNLVKDVRQADKDLKGLKEAVDMVDKNRLKFPHIKDAELGARKRFVGDMAAIIADVKGGLESQTVRRKIEDDENKTSRESYDETMNALSGGGEENSRFIKNQQLQTKEALVNQDKALESLGQSVDKLHEIGRGVNEELKEQNIMLDGLETDLDHTAEKFNVVQEALGKLLKTKDGCQIWTIVCLGVILIILVCLVIWA